jgi:hypothetical protein
MKPWDYKTRLRITPWPGEPLALPDLQRRPYPIHGWAFGFRGGIWAPDNAYSSGGPYPGLGESYLELAAIDLDDEKAIRAFVDRWGTLGVRWFQDPVSGEQVEDLDYSRIFGASPDGRPGPFADQIIRLRESIESASDEAGTDTWVVETLAEFRFGARLVRDLLRAWRWQRNGLTPTDRWEFLPEIFSPQTPEAAAELADDWAHGLLSAFYPQFVRVEITGTGEMRRTEPYFSAVPLLSLMALELYNHACEDAEYKICQNETCGRLFVRQKGRALHGQHRTAGVKYCTSECARAQAQRSYRRRNRQA